MKKLFPLLAAFVCWVCLAKAQPPLPKVVSGKIIRVEQFASKYTSSRTVDIWLPPGYTPEQQYAVLYMHDGQMLFDADQSWNKQSWDVDDVAADLMARNQVRKFIVVGIWNGGQTRHPDYFPQKPFERMTQKEKDTVIAQLQRAGRTKEVFRPVSDRYLKFIVKELKPYIDKNYSVFTNKENTFIAGSSMGGLISMYALCEYPSVFGGAACLSTHWPGTFTLENNPVPAAFFRYLGKQLPKPARHKIYFDYGDKTLDALYPALQQQADSVLRLKGYTAGNWMTKYFPGADHSEAAWKKRLDIPLLFLLGK